MKAVILAGGYGTRISEETNLRPKPMIEIGNMPIIWHIMKYYSSFGVTEFIICCGYKSYVIKEYFANYFLHNSDVTFDMSTNQMEVHKKDSEPWKVTLIETGLNTMTGGRLRRVKKYVENEDFFFFTYGDGLCNIDIDKQVLYHKKHGKQATVTAVQPPGRYGILNMDEDKKVSGFLEKPVGDGALINGGYFVLSPSCIDLILGDDTTWEAEPLMTLAESGELMAYNHNEFWQSMDTLRDKNLLESLWNSGNAPWKIWES